MLDTAAHEEEGEEEEGLPAWLRARNPVEAAALDRDVTVGVNGVETNASEICPTFIIFGVPMIDLCLARWRREKDGGGG